jgi:hypothetical protein
MSILRRNALITCGLTLTALGLAAGGCGTISESNQAALERMLNDPASYSEDPENALSEFLDSALSLPGATVSETDSKGSARTKSLTAGSESGACCLPDGTCASFLLESECNALDGLFQGLDTTCNSCTGACLFDAFQPPSQCSLTSLFGGIGFLSCSNLIEISCTTQGGSFQGIGATCSSVTGACCFDTGCVRYSLETDCDQAGGRFKGLGSNCSSCLGACCVYGDRCTDVFQACGCTEFLGGVFQGDGTRCTDPTITCPNPTGACCPSPLLFPSGPVPTPTKAILPLVAAVQTGIETSCSFTDTGLPCCEGFTEFTCYLLSSEYHGDDSRCTEAACFAPPCPAPGDCCVPHRNNGCADKACCEAVCRVEPRCCLGNNPILSFLGSPEQGWDNLCVATAQRVCNPGVESCTSCPGLGDCCEANGSGGCTEESCCRKVCSVDPYCCDNEWDAFCAASAAWACGNTCLFLGDFNDDGSIDLYDYAIFQVMFTGP